MIPLCWVLQLDGSYVSFFFYYFIIDYDPLVVEQKEQSQPSCLPLSYVLRFITDAARKEGPFINNSTNTTDSKRKLAIKHHSYSLSSSNRSNTPTGLSFLYANFVK